MKKIISKVLPILLCVSMVLTSLVVLASCSGDKDTDTQKEDLTYLVEDGVAKYGLVRSDKASKKVIDLAVELRKSINEKFGCDVTLDTDWVKPGEEVPADTFEILLGDTNRPESAEVKATLEMNSWAIHNKGNKVVICATDEAMLSIAVDWFIENYVTAAKAEKSLGIPKDMATNEGFGDALPISINGMSSYQIAYTNGNANIKYFASLIQKHVKMNGSAPNVVSDHSTSGDNIISVAVDSSLAANEYKIVVDGAKVNVRGADENALYYAVNYFLEYGVKVDETVVSLSKDYQLSGKLENYTSTKWELGIPAFDHSNIARSYNVGPGLENDKNADTITDTRLHLLSNVTKQNCDDYGKKLESFGFKNVFNATTDENTLTGYRLGEAYVYIHYVPRQSVARVIWDKSSNCEVSDFEYTAQGDGTTTFYQYSLDYTNAALNYTGGGINCGMLYIIKLADNSLILVDSGHNNQSKDESLQGICDFLYEITGTNRKDQLNIKFWYFTHPDGDHNELTIKLFNYMKSHGYKTPHVENLAHAYPSARAMGKTDGSYEMIELMKAYFPDINFIRLHTGMVINIGEVKFEVISTIENFVGTNGNIPDGYKTNDVCSVVRFSFDGMTVLMQGDQGGGSTKEAYLLNMYSKDYIKSDVMQLAHHGFNNTADMFAACKPTYALLPNSMPNMNASVKGNVIKRGGVLEKNILAGGDYTYGLKMTNGKIEVIQIMRYDNPNKK